MRIAIQKKWLLLLLLVATAVAAATYYLDVDFPGSNRNSADREASRAWRNQVDSLTGGSAFAELALRDSDVVARFTDGVQRNYTVKLTSNRAWLANLDGTIIIANGGGSGGNEGTSYEICRAVTTYTPVYRTINGSVCTPEGGCTPTSTTVFSHMLMSQAGMCV